MRLLSFALGTFFSCITSYAQGYLCKLEYFEALSRYNKDIVTLRSSVLFDANYCHEENPAVYQQSFGDLSVQISCQSKLILAITSPKRTQTDTAELNEFNSSFFKAYTSGHSGLRITCTKTQIGEIITKTSL